MVETPSQNRSAGIRRAFVGAALVLAGVFAIVALIVIGNSRTAVAEHAMMSLGLGGSALLSAIAQGMIFLGGWMLWTATRRRSKGRPV